MLKALQTHFNAPVGVELLREVRARNFRMARIDAQRSDEALTRAMLDETQEADLLPYVTVREARQLYWLSEGMRAECLNEPNLEFGNPMAYAALLAEMAAVADDRGIHLYAPAISNLDRKGFAYLEAIGTLPTNVRVSVHWYSHGPERQTPHPGFQSRSHEVAHLRSFIGSRTWGLSETGYHTAEQPRYTDWRKNLPIKTRLTDQQVADYVRADFGFWAAQGAEFAVLYQLNDGPTDTKEDRFGIRGKYVENGEWYFKPVAEVFA